MSVPELYWYGRKGKWFGMGQFIVHMVDGVTQVSHVGLFEHHLNTKET
jgi:hypothetical protein